MRELLTEFSGREAESFRPLMAHLQGKKGAPPYIPSWALMSIQKQCQLALLWQEGGFLKEARELWGWLSPLKSFPCLWCPESEFDEEKTRNAFAELQNLEPIFGWKPDCDLTLLEWEGGCAALTLDGRGTSLGMIQCGMQVRSFGPQADTFGIEGRGMNHWTRTFAYQDVWLEMKPEVKDGALELKFNFVGITLEKSCSLALYIKAGSCEVGKEILKPKSLKRFFGEAQTVQFEKTTLQSSHPHKMEVIPLAGEGCFWGAEFLLKYSISPFSPVLTLQILNPSSLIAK
jgi:hypothetical protein